MNLAGRAGDSLGENAGVFVDQDAHRFPLYRFAEVLRLRS